MGILCLPDAGWLFSVCGEAARETAVGFLHLLISLLSDSPPEPLLTPSWTRKPKTAPRVGLWTGTQQDGGHSCFFLCVVVTNRKELLCVWGKGTKLPSDLWGRWGPNKLDDFIICETEPKVSVSLYPGYLGSSWLEMLESEQRVCKMCSLPFKVGFSLYYHALLDLSYCVVLLMSSRSEPKLSLGHCPVKEEKPSLIPDLYYWL